MKLLPPWTRDSKPRARAPRRSRARTRRAALDRALIGRWDGAAGPRSSGIPPAARRRPAPPRLDSPARPAAAALLGLAGAYLLRALTEVRHVSPPAPASPSASLYAIAWLVWAARTPAARRLEAALHSLTSVLVLVAAALGSHPPLPRRLHLDRRRPSCSPSPLFGLAISWRKDLLIVATIATLAGLGTAAALLVATHDVLPFTFVFLAIAAAVEVSACLDHWLCERWLAAAAADLAVAAGHLAGHQRARPARRLCADPARAGSLAAQVALLAIYLASTIVRTLLRGFTFTAFETAQCAAAFAISVGGGLPLSPAMPVVCGLLWRCLLPRGVRAARAAGATSTRIRPSRSCSWSPAAASCSPARLPPRSWSALAIACAWSGRAHAPGPRRRLSRCSPCAGAPAISPTDCSPSSWSRLCYLGGAARPSPHPALRRLRLGLRATSPAALPADSFRLAAASFCIYGAALIVLPRLEMLVEPPHPQFRNHASSP